MNYFCYITHEYTAQKYCRRFHLDSCGPELSIIVQGIDLNTLLAVECPARDVQVRKYTDENPGAAMGVFTARNIWKGERAENY